MNDNLILQDLIKAKRNNPYTKNKTINELRKETETAGALIPLPDNTKFKRILAGSVYAEWITCGEIDSERIFSVSVCVSGCACVSVCRVCVCCGVCGVCVCVCVCTHINIFFLILHKYLVLLLRRLGICRLASRDHSLRF